jgi:hypothetical protein
MTATNPCSPSGTSSAVTPIYVSIPPEANFNANNFTCVNTISQYKTLQEEDMWHQVQDVLQEINLYGLFLQTKGVTVVSGSLGDTRG